jgi:hypothetical protein
VFPPLLFLVHRVMREAHRSYGSQASTLTHLTSLSLDGVYRPTNFGVYRTCLEL